MRVFLNEDWLHYIWTRQEEDVCEKDMKSFIEQYRNTTITDFLFNINGTVSTSPSNILETWTDKYLAKEENGVKVDYTDTWAKRAYDIYNVKGIDMYSVFIETCKEIGINPWLSFRMNDAHCNMKKTDIRKSSQVEKNADKWISAHRAAVGYFDRCFDYSYSEVRNTMLNYIEEQLKKYDVYGIELDFTREPFCFACGEEDDGIEIINAFMADVKKIVDEIGKSRGKHIYMCVLGQDNPVSALKTGFDFSTMAKKGLIDFFVASPRWHTINNDIPIELWKDLLGDKVKFGCSQGLLLSTFGEVYKMVDVATDMGQTASNVCRGCDIVYLYNHFDNIENGLDDLFHKDAFRTEKNIRYIYENIGKVDEYEKWERRVPITYDDFCALNEKISSRLPVTSKFEQFRLPSGRIDTERKIYIHLVLKEKIDGESISLYANGKKAEYRKDIKDEIVFADGNVYTFTITITTKKIIGIETLFKENVTICYLDAVIPPA